MAHLRNQNTIDNNRYTHDTTPNKAAPKHSAFATESFTIQSAMTYTHALRTNDIKMIVNNIICDRVITPCLKDLIQNYNFCNKIDTKNNSNILQYTITPIQAIRVIFIVVGLRMLIDTMPNTTTNKPIIINKIVNNIIFDRLAPVL